MSDQGVNPKLLEISDCLYRLASKVVIIQDNKMLLVEEQSGEYGLPGGGNDYGQTPQETIVRELEEELGIKIEVSLVSNQPFYISSEGIIDGIPRLTLFYMASLSDEVSPNAVELKYKWATREELTDIALRPNIEPSRQTLLLRLS